MSKLSDLIGTSLSFFKLGKSGPRFRNNAGELEARNNADSAYANFAANLLKLFSNGAFKTILQSDPAVAADLTFQFPLNKGTAASMIVATPDGVLNKSVFSLSPLVLTNLSLVKQGTGIFSTGGGTPTTVFTYTPGGALGNFALNSGSRGGSSFVNAATCNADQFECRIDNGFSNTGTMTAYLSQITGTALGGTPPVIAVSDTINFDPVSFVPGTFTPAIFTFAGEVLTAGIEYAVLVTSSATVFAGVGTNQAGSTNYTTTNTGTVLAQPGNQNTLYNIVTATIPVLELTTDSIHYIAVGNLPLNYHQINPITEEMADGDVAFVTINRAQAAPTVLTVTIVALGSFVPNFNNVIIARRVGDVIYYGFEDAMAMASDQTVNFASAPLLMKSGFLASGDFSGTPLVGSVVFNTAMPDTNYSITAMGEDDRGWTFENKTASGFDINSNSVVALTGDVVWSIMAYGEA